MVLEEKRNNAHELIEHIASIENAAGILSLGTDESSIVTGSVGRRGHGSILQSIRNVQDRSLLVTIINTAAAKLPSMGG